MDGIHDLGGKEGHGPIRIDPEETLFEDRWEERVFGLFYALHQPEDWTGDWFRFCRELIPPEQYLTRPYYDQWLQSLAAMLLNSGVVTLDELVTGRSQGALPDRPRLQSAVDVARLKSRSESFERAAEVEPRFGVGASVRARELSTPGHTRLPQYVRGHIGTVRRCQGCHVLPDRNALGEEVAEPLYLVEFQADAIWADARSRRDTVLLDLWESYLASA